MADRNEEVQEKVKEALEERPGISVRELYEMAQTVDPAMGDVELRQFNGSYVLPLKRARSRARGETPARARKPRGSRKKAKPRGAGGAAEKGAGRDGGRERVRGVLLQFARDLSGAESRSEIIDVLAKLDRYADRVLEVVGRR